MDAVRTSRSPNLEHIIWMLLLTGARKQEVLQARWADIDLDRKRWHIAQTKAGRARNVPLSDTLVEMLRKLPSREGSPYVFPCPKTGEPYKAIYNVWDRARKKAGLPDVRLHDLRHSFASFLINSGHSLYEVQKLLGHHSISVTERYAHLADETLKNACERAAATALNREAIASRADTASSPPADT